MDIAIVGADGTGKSTIVDALSEQLGYRALHLTQFDSYNSTPAWLFGKALKWSASQAQRLGSAIGGALSGTIRLSYLLPTLIEERELGENVVWDRHPCIDTLAYARVYLPSGKVGEVMSREVRGHTRDYLYSLFGVPEFVFYLDGPGDLSSRASLQLHEKPHLLEMARAGLLEELEEIEKRGSVVRKVYVGGKETRPLLEHILGEIYRHIEEGKGTLCMDGRDNSRSRDARGSRTTLVEEAFSDSPGDLTGLFNGERSGRVVNR